MIAFLFPGQGSQFAGFLHTLGGTTPHARIAETIEEASDVLHIDVLSLDHADALNSTVAVNSACSWRASRLCVRCRMKASYRTRWRVYRWARMALRSHARPSLSTMPCCSFTCALN